MRTTCQSLFIPHLWTLLILRQLLRDSSCLWPKMSRTCERLVLAFTPQASGPHSNPKLLWRPMSLLKAATISALYSWHRPISGYATSGLKVSSGLAARDRMPPNTSSSQETGALSPIQYRVTAQTQCPAASAPLWGSHPLTSCAQSFHVQVQPCMLRVGETDDWS